MESMWNLLNCFCEVHLRSHLFLMFNVNIYHLSKTEMANCCRTESRPASVKVTSGNVRQQMYCRNWSWCFIDIGQEVQQQKPPTGEGGVFPRGLWGNSMVDHRAAEEHDLQQLHANKNGGREATVEMMND